MLTSSPECILPVVLLCLFALPEPVYPQQPGAFTQESAPTPSLAEPLKNLVFEVFEQSKKVHCLPSDCKILITNFVSADDQTSRFGMQIADAFSEQLSKGDKPFSVVDRSVFQSFLQRQRLSSRLQGEKSVAQWLARQLGANAVIVGRTTKSGDNLLKLSVDLLDALGENRKTLTLKMSLTVDFSTLDLSPTDGLARLTPLTDTLNSEKVYQAGMQRAGFPSCFYMPNPTYTQDARNGHFSGTVVLEAEVGTKGEVRARRIIKGAPYGLNEASVDTLNKWKCQPAKMDGKPIPVIAAFEVNFRLN